MTEKLDFVIINRRKSAISFYYIIFGKIMNMLGDEELKSMLADLESDRVERKRSSSEHRDDIRQAICAFANDLPDHRQPGIIFIGVNNDGSCANISISDEILLNLSHMRDDGQILPFPTMTIQKKSLNNCEIAVIAVLPSYYPPVRYNGRVWIRVGPRRAQATAEEERRLVEKRRSGDLTYDQHPVPDSHIEDLDIVFFQTGYLPSAVAPEVIRENERTITQQLTSLRFLDRDGVPNVAAVLVFGKDPLRWVPGGRVQFLRIDGEKLTDPIRHQKEMTGSLPTLLGQLDEILAANISIATDVKSEKLEVQHPDYPIVALQQISRNAIMHRSYENTNAPVRIYWFSDRIEISSPGGLYGQVTPENFGKGATDYRNPLLSEVMKVLGYVQRFGIGIPLAKQELLKNGNPEPEYRFEPGTILAIIRRYA